MNDMLQLRQKRLDFLDFMEGYDEEKERFGGWVPAHMLTVTGIILHELIRDGKVETDGYGYRPA